VNPSILAQLQTFTEDILLPAFLELKQTLETSETKVLIVSHSSTGVNELDAVLHQMHPGKPYLSERVKNQSSSPQETPISAQIWIGESLYIETFQSIGIAPVCIGRYCFSIKFTVTPTAEIQAAFTVGIMLSGYEQLQIQSHPSKNSFQLLDIQSIKSNDIVLLVIEGFEDFEATLFAYKISLTESPKIEKSELNPTFDTDTYNHSEPTSLDSSEPSTAYLSSSKNSEVLSPTIEQFIDPQTLYDLSKQLTQALAPSGFTITSKLNLKLPTPAQIKPIQDRYQRIIDLSLEYSPAITEPELIEYLHRLGHYQTLKHLAHLHTFIQEQMQAWHKQNGQPSPGAIAPHLQQQIIELRDHLYQCIQTLTDSQLNSTAQTLKHEIETLTTQQQHQQTLLDQLEKNPLLGYLDTHLLDPNSHLKEPIQPFTNSSQPINLSAQHYKAKNSRAILSHIASCDGEKYKTYHQRKPDRPALKRIIEYAITQKLYPQRPVFIGIAAKAVYPRLELLWGQTDDSFLNPNPLTQIWCIYPMMRTDPPQWLIIAATTDTQPLKTILLENGQIAQEGTYEYLERSLHLMSQSEDEYTQAISQRVTEALAHRRLKYLHIHQTQNSQTKTSRDILQMQFQIFG
jgi:hypothetical protein